MDHRLASSGAPLKASHPFLSRPPSLRWSAFAAARSSFRAIQREIQDSLQRFIAERPSQRFRMGREPDLLAHGLRSAASELLRDGVVVLPSYFSGKALEAMQTDFQQWCNERNSASLGFIDFDGAKPPNYLTRSVALSRAAIDFGLTTMAEHYWGRSVVLSYAHGYRLDPVEPIEYRAFRWHHDLWGKYLKVMIYLTDVPSTGQRLDYIIGSHKIPHRFANHRDVRFTNQEATRHGPVVRCGGPAGTVVLFDANGVHRGNRNLGPQRDQYTFVYTAASRQIEFGAPPLAPEVEQTLTNRERHLVRQGNGA